MKRITMMSVAIAMLVALAGVSLAETDPGTGGRPATTPPSGTRASTRTPRIDQRRANQHARVQQGVKSGELTRHEARNVRHGERHVRRVERRAKADGTVTTKERRHITAAQNHESKKIYRKKHNNRTR